MRPGISDLHFARLKRNKRWPFVCHGDGVAAPRYQTRTSGQPPGIHVARISFLPDFLSAGCNVRGVSRRRESALNLHLDLERWSRRKGEEVEATWESSKDGGEWGPGGNGEYKEIRRGYHESSSETRNSSASYFLSPHVRGLHSHSEDILTSEIQLSLIFTSLGMSCVQVREPGGDDRFLRKSRVSIRSHRHNSRVGPFISRLANLFASQWIAIEVAGIFNEQMRINDAVKIRG